MEYFLLGFFSSWILSSWDIFLHGIFSWWDFVLWDFVLMEFFPLGYCPHGIFSSGILSSWDFFLHGILSSWDFFLESRKRRKYTALAESHQFEPIAVETMRVYGGSTGVILRATGQRLVEATEEPRDANWLHQNLAIAVQWDYAFSILSAGRENF